LLSLINFVQRSALGEVAFEEIIEHEGQQKQAIWVERNRQVIVVRCILCLFFAIVELLFNNKWQIGFVLASTKEEAK